VHYACVQYREFSKLIGKKDKVRGWIRLSECKPLSNFPCQYAVLMMSLSKRLLLIALIAYVIGLGVYLGSLRQNQLDTAAGHNDSRNIFIVFLITVPLCYSLTLFAKVKNMDCCLWENLLAAIKTPPDRDLTQRNKSDVESNSEYHRTKGVGIG
jgi:hypothetical protein